MSSDNKMRIYDHIYRGVVISNEDPDKLGRCKIQVYAIHDTNSTFDSLPWARPIVLSPLNFDRGSVNIPDKGDIVWVMFENGVKDFPVYLGGTYSTADAVPAETDRVVIYTEHQDSITYFREERKYNINVGGHHITISEDGISIGGDTNIDGNLSVTGDVNIDGELTVGGNGTFKSDVTIDGNLYLSGYMVGGEYGLYSDMDFTGLSQEEMESVLAEMGIDDLTNPLAVASKLIGFNEADGSADMFTKALGYGKSDVTPWCACFVSYCLDKAGITGLRSASTSALRRQAESLGIYHSKADQNYTPQPGDVFINDGHTGFVKSYDASTGTIYTVEGNASDQVKEGSYKMSNSKVLGFIQLSN